MVKKLSCVSCGSLKRFPHTFTIATSIYVVMGIMYPLVELKLKILGKPTQATH